MQRRLRAAFMVLGGPQPPFGLEAVQLPSRPQSPELGRFFITKVPDRSSEEAMAGIARNIELYNSAYRLAWEHIPERHNRTSLGVFTIASGARLRRGQA
jgi:hypothetical protein